jgi:hypothetical protein
MLKFYIFLGSKNHSGVREGERREKGREMRASGKG